MPTEHMTVTGMSCGGCMSKVTHALDAVSGVEFVRVSLVHGNALVRFNEWLTSAKQLHSAVTNAGYGVNGAKGAEKSKGGCCC